MLKIGTLDQYLNRENITAFYSKCGRLVGLDYNKTATFSRDWDNLTMTARGLVFEVATGRLVSRAYDKFYNLHEPEVGGIAGLPDGVDFDSLEKADGSMISAFKYAGQIWYMTRGSFYSDQAKWAKSWADSHLNELEMTAPATYIYEAIYPENRIVVNYGDVSELRLTGVRMLDTGEFLPYNEMLMVAAMLNCNTIKRYQYSTVDEVIDAVKQFTMNEEGIVLRYRNGFMVKIKGDEYCKVHRIISCITPLAFWRAIDIETFKIPTDFLTNLPEEFRHDVDELVKKIEDVHINEYNRIVSFAESVPEFPLDAEGKKQRFAYVAANCKPYELHVMNILNNKHYLVRDWIHRHPARPTGNKIDGMSESLRRFLEESDE